MTTFKQGNKEAYFSSLCVKWFLGGFIVITHMTPLKVDITREAANEMSWSLFIQRLIQIFIGIVTKTPHHVIPFYFHPLFLNVQLGCGYDFLNGGSYFPSLSMAI